MFFPNRHWRLQDDLPGASGSGAAPSPAPAANGVADTNGGSSAGGGESSIDIAKVSAEIGSELFGRKDAPDDSAAGRTAARDATGKFVGQSAAEPAPPAPAPGTPPVASPAPAPAPAPGAAEPSPAPGPGKAVDLTKPPESWKPDEAKDWAALPESVRAAVHRREQDMFRGLEQYRGDANIGKTMKAVVQPVLRDLQQAGVQPDHFMSGLVRAHMSLADSNIPIEQRAGFAVNMLKRYGIDLAEFNLGPAAGEPRALPAEAERALRAEIQALQSQITERDRREATKTFQTLSSEIEAFSKDPQNEFFNDVASDMAMLIKGSDGQLSLKDAYERAVRANPATFAKVQVKLEQAALAKAAEDARKRAEELRKATGANVNSSGHSGQQNSGQSGSMEDTMWSTLQAIKKRG